MDKITRPIYMLPTRDTSQIDIQRLIVNGWKRYFMLMAKEKTSRVAVLIPDKVDFKTMAIVRDKEGHYIMKKGTIQQKDITLVYAPNIEAPKYIKQILMQREGEINRNTIIVRDFNTPLTSMDRSSRQKINKEMAVSSDSLDQIDLIDIFRPFHPKAAQYSYFSTY